jgi:ArsR family transcriptional regulator
LPAMSTTAISLPAASTPDAGALAALCKASGDPLRLEILRVLSRDSFGVLELSQILAMPQSGMSHHLKILTRAGLLATRREGNSIFYRRAQLPAASALAQLQQALLATIDNLPADAAVDARIETVRAGRSQRSQQFFAENASHFRAQQELIAGFDVYGAQAAELLASCLPLDAHAHGGASALEVGPGEGAFLAYLAPHFERVVALDNSREMLEQARQFADRSGFSNIEFMYGDTGSALRSGIAVDCIVLNMVLHHVPSPAAMFQDLARMLKPQGTLLVTELCRHDQLWTQQACGDLWQGFEPEDLTQWAQTAGLTPGHGVYLAQRNGFRVQIRQFVNQTSHHTHHHHLAKGN